MWWLLREADIDRSTDVVTWNVVPWYVGTDHKIRPVSTSDLLFARPYIRELISLLPDLSVVVLIGKKAADGWSHLGIDVETIEAPLPSPQNLNTRPSYRTAILDALVEARQRARLI